MSIPTLNSKQVVVALVILVVLILARLATNDDAQRGVELMEARKARQAERASQPRSEPATPTVTTESPKKEETPAAYSRAVPSRQPRTIPLVASPPPLNLELRYIYRDHAVCSTTPGVAAYMKQTLAALTADGGVKLVAGMSKTLAACETVQQ